MLSKNQIKLVSSLQQKKYRKEYGLFLAEGIKVIRELLESKFELEYLYMTENLFEELPAKFKMLVSVAELNKMSALSTANNCLALFRIPKDQLLKETGLIVALDDIRDPGNLGTIIRLCDWFGVAQIVCTKETVDLYNPKVVQATMGSIARVDVHYIDLESFLSTTKLPIYGAFMEGNNIYKEELSKQGIIVLGNEANGISKKIENKVSHKIAIPQFGDLQKTESLNVATATAIVLSEFKRTF
ncbi:MULTISPECIES: TrmH family RNA methyltransferase [Flavobacterium]|uniref:RNA methyltransferase n=2 Tax=Flavobacterium TaxID=237 RepID=A0AA94F399_9FLAO|nr:MULTISPECIES: RNA methyltransferase [Flavobacterium]OXA81227.1 RNA methyltransferase [Flavobacterium columnare] [Flavobacterium columnare NBRC 100251 = ATCC 23463]AMA50096.1 RNA methyltransferase [Flavobacterium covae]AND64378.1 RNA methyltransferase [Flavobacterium covae]MCH4829307.1 RNA methyltransferase [Flavobacterium columnare]MCH4834083.1 RNA methyltransferase [Flavobacterium columnare]